MSGGSTVDVVVRHHDATRLDELEKCVFSLLCQTHRHVAIYVVTQRFDADQIHATRDRLAPMLPLNGDAKLDVIAWNEEHPKDARSALLNAGIAAGQGRYLAFLDYDDVLFPHAYATLLGALDRSGAAIAFGGITVSEHRTGGIFHFAKGRLNPFVPGALLDELAHNFCPIHSFVVDKQRVRPGQIYFDETMRRAEDYDFILRLISRYRSDFSCAGNKIGLYTYKDDGSNTIIQGNNGSASALLSWVAAERFLDARRRNLEVSREVQVDLGFLAPIDGLTVSQLLEMHGRLSPAAA